MIWYSIDPGIKYYALATWNGATLVGCGVLPIDACTPWRDFAVLEQPVNQGRTIRAQTLAKLSASYGRLLDRYKTIRAYSYQEWAGGNPPELVQRRVREKLTPAELALLPSKKKELEHILDAIGVGQYHLRREHAQKEDLSPRQDPVRASRRANQG